MKAHSSLTVGAARRPHVSVRHTTWHEPVIQTTSRKHRSQFI